MQEQEETLDSSAYSGMGLSRSPLPKLSPYLAQRSSMPQQLSPPMVSQTPVTWQSIMQWGKILINRSKAKKSGTELKQISDVRALIRAKRFKATPSKAGFQIHSFLSAINLLIHKEIC